MWEHITIFFVVGLHQTMENFDFIWLIMDRLTKSAHYILVKVNNNAEKLSKVNIRDIV